MKLTNIETSKLEADTLRHRIVFHFEGDISVSLYFEIGKDDRNTVISQLLEMIKFLMPR